MIRNISAATAKELIEKGTKIIDVREKDEFILGHIPNAISLPFTTIQKDYPRILSNKNEPFIVYCKSGRRSKSSALFFDKLGYSSIYDMGGIINWSYDIAN